MGVIRRQGIKNTITGYLGILIGFVNLVVVQPYFLTKEELGLTRVLYSLALLVAMFVPIGIGNATIKYFPLFKDAEKKHHGYFGFMNLFPIVGFIFSALIIFLFKGMILDAYRKESPLFVEFFNYVFPLIFFNSFIAVLSVYCNANYKSTIPSFINDVGVRIMTIAVVSIYYLRWINLDQFIFSFVMIYGIQFALILIYIFSFERPGFKIDWESFREKKMFDLIRYGLLLWFASVASIGLQYFDSIMIGKYISLAAVGIYTVAAFIPTVIETPLNAFDRIASAKISFAWSADDKAQILEIYHKSSLYMFLLGGFLFLNINVNIHTVLTYLPQGFQEGEIVVLIISIGKLFNMATGLNSSILLTSKKYKFGAAYLIALAILLILFQQIFIPRYGITGAAIATTAASMVYNTMLFITVYSFFKLQPFDAKNLKVLALIAVIFIGTYLLPHLENRIMDLAFRTTVVSSLYLAMVYFLKIVPEFHPVINRSLPGKNN